jgi:cytochrome c biogenesis protein CcdA/thiol-disulfide isomerase/thioredoxin
VLVTVVAFLAGIVSVLTPCVLPLLPALLAVSGSGDRRRVTGLVLGIITSFGIGLVALTALLSAAGTVGDGLRWVAVAILSVIGVLFLVPPAKDRVEAATSRLVSRVRPGAADATRTGLAGGLLTGLALGVVWTPCAGPILAAVAVAAAQDDLGARSLITLVAFCLGMAIPLTLIALGGRRVGTWLRTRLGGRRLDVATGVVLLVTAGLIASGLDVRLNRWVAENTALGTTITADLEASALADTGEGGDGSGGTDLSPATLRATGYPELDDLADLGPAPTPSGLGPWFNTAGSQPLTAEDLDGKVVLVDFWTYSCINCLRTLPYLRAWHDAYSDEGLVVVGVHAPEFAFESVPANVEQALADLEVTWPVALDNDYETWAGFHNRYWPAKYLIDRDGTLRYAHYGEGEYARTEQHIQTLLGTSASIASDQIAATERTGGQTPETYRRRPRVGHPPGRTGPLQRARRTRPRHLDPRGAVDGAGRALGSGRGRRALGPLLRARRLHRHGGHRRGEDAGPGRRLRGPGAGRPDPRARPGLRAALRAARLPGRGRRPDAPAGTRRRRRVRVHLRLSERPGRRGYRATQSLASCTLSLRKVRTRAGTNMLPTGAIRRSHPASVTTPSRFHSGRFSTPSDASCQSPSA